MGFRRSQYVNNALMTILGWKILIDLDHIWVKVVSVKYLIEENFLAIWKIAKALTT